MRQLYIGLFGILGVFARYYGELGIERVLHPPFPYGTFLVNASGAFAIGSIYVLGVEHAAIPEDMRIGIMVGFLGGFTTFSSYCLEFVRLVEEGEYWVAALYALLSTAVGFGAAFCGIFLARRLFTGGSS